MIELPIERIDPPSPDAFVRDYVRRSRPVVIRGAIEDWPARERWTPAALAGAHGDREVTAIPVEDGRARFDARGGVSYLRIRLRDFVNELETRPPSRYVVFRVDEGLPELLRDIRAPAYTRHAPWQRSRFWFAPAGVSSVLHRDLPENLYAQVYGRKRWILAAPRTTRRVYSYPPWSGVPNFARADLEHPDTARFPRLRGLRVHATVLAPGELLYIPRLWWHQASSVETSVSINLWWADGVLHAAVRAAELVMALRRLRY